ncbi:hypothetical protein J3492_01095 [Psychrobacter sp. F1192]|uniref:Sigma-like protein n=1 Tax=Psychrobacter coccoides TaxID=2818440 RepID=A0ABS3NK87_9GAMM|nr:hypothetical protein [Psychrobacter coccoides]MBO1529811.1 hypothetical protein [Psychrobacter coccoides]
MSTSKDKPLTQDYQLQDADDNDGIVPDDALQKVNPAAAEQQTPDHDPHNVAKGGKEYDSTLTESKD